MSIASCSIAKDKQFERLPCSHAGTYADDCLCERVQQSRCYIVATNDKDLKKRIREAPGSPAPDLPPWPVCGVPRASHSPCSETVTRGLGDEARARSSPFVFGDQHTVPKLLAVRRARLLLASLKMAVVRNTHARAHPFFLSCQRTARGPGKIPGVPIMFVGQHKCVAVSLKRQRAATQERTGGRARTSAKHCVALHSEPKRLIIQM